MKRRTWKPVKPAKKENQETPKEIKPLATDLKINQETISQSLGNSADIVTREFTVNQKKVMIIFLEALVNKDHIQHYLIEQIINLEWKTDAVSNDEMFQQLKSASISASELNEIDNFQDLLMDLLDGNSILLLDEYPKGLSIESNGVKERGVESPTTQQVVRGPKDSFTETLTTNIGLVRKRLKDPNLRLESRILGQKTQTKVSLIYLHGVASPEIVEEVRRRIDRINVDFILESGNLEELIQDKTYTLFPTVFNSERPDEISAGILKGKIAIMIDGTPFVLLVPALFVDFFHSSEDYYQRNDISTFIRGLRFLAFFLALLTPSTYIALTTFHPEMIPTILLVSLAAQREGIPFPALVEALMMEITFELLREAGIRLPTPIGSAISIVGALVLGQAAVDAGIVSATMVIVVSLTAICSFIFPSYSLSISVRLLRFGFMIAAATLGLFGIFVGILLLALHLTSLRSFGIPYLAPFAPFIPQDQGDAVIRKPKWGLVTRPRLVNQRDIRREDTPKPKP
ncbi:spore germination protein [Gracilibacillus alcaliphilus]|uniref:spore germination protein n=1 Tax=Gracilibacillus alcaliphilus TaxID=1401441 RepID=UPI0019581B3E|nr:spore germination protein [Gracilibacillus alcaliphilus]MBM7676546.1 spore germination protein KA [Gracilibacillus alcaliphilus]